MKHKSHPRVRKGAPLSADYISVLEKIHPELNDAPAEKKTPEEL